VADVAIRFATVHDAPTVAKIHCDSWRRHYRGMYSDRYLDGDLYGERLATWTSRLQRDGSVTFTLIAELDGQPIGFGHVVLDADRKWGALVDNLHVVHGVQGKGVGSLLLADIAKIVSERRPGSGLYLWVLELNTAAQGFYVSRHGALGDVEASPAPGNDPRNLEGATRRVRVTWPDPARLMRP
jgi:GNAT superfamily N-acetyltransferase